MILTQTPLKGAWIIDIEPAIDHRGFFARTFCQDTFEAHNIHVQWIQTSISYNAKKGTLRGMHFQKAPHEEAKLVRCLSGKIYDVIVDLRENSPTYQQTFAIELSAEKRNALYIPKGFAHGFQTLQDNTEILYYISENYYPESASGIPWNDPTLHINWPITNPIISDKDQTYQRLNPKIKN